MVTARGHNQINSSDLDRTYIILFDFDRTHDEIQLMLTENMILVSGLLQGRVN